MKNYMKSPTAGSTIFMVLLTASVLTLVGEYVISRPVNGYLQVAAILATLGLIGLTAKMLANLLNNAKGTVSSYEIDLSSRATGTLEEVAAPLNADNVVQSGTISEPIRPEKRKPAPRKKAAPKGEKPANTAAEAKPAPKKPRKPRAKKETEIKKEK